MPIVLVQRGKEEDVADTIRRVYMGLELHCQ